MNGALLDSTATTNRPIDSLFRPFRIKSLDLPNRIVMSPMGRAFAKDGVLEPECADYYRRRVEGGTPLIIGEAAGIDPVSLSASSAPFFFGEAALAAWENACRQVKAAGGYFMPQLWHAGLGRSPGTGPFPELPSKGPSGVFLPNVDNELRVQPERIVGEPMTLAEIEAVIDSYAQAAVAAQRMGCDGVNVHGGHGYLIDQFLWSRSNRRTDAYGGSLANRVRFAVDVVSEIRRRVGPDFPIFMRLSQWKVQDYGARIATTPGELAEILEPLVDAGVDLFDCSTRRFWEPEFAGSELNLAGWAKKLTGVPTMTVGSVGLDSAIVGGSDEGYEAYLANAANPEVDLSKPASLDQLIDRLERDEFDLVAVGRAIIANPAWTNIVRAEEYGQLKPYNRKALLTLD